MTSGADTEPLLAGRGLGKSFGLLRAVDDVTIEIVTGNVTGLMGPNGAGKTTLLNLLSGLIKPDSGRVRYLGVDVTRMSTVRLARRRLVRTFQHPRLVPELTCLENIMLGAQTPASSFSHLFAWVPVPRMRRDSTLVDQSVAALRFVGVHESKWLKRPGAVPPQDHRWLEIARALAASPRVLLLDEPSAGFTKSDIQQLVSLIRDLTQSAEWGIGVLLVTHDVSLGLTVSSQVAVMDRGNLIGCDVPEKIVELPAVREAYLGTRSAELARRVVAGSKA